MKYILTVLPDARPRAPRRHHSPGPRRNINYYIIAFNYDSRVLFQAKPSDDIVGKWPGRFLHQLNESPSLRAVVTNGLAAAAESVIHESHRPRRSVVGRLRGRGAI